MKYRRFSPLLSSVSGDLHVLQVTSVKMDVSVEVLPDVVYDTILVHGYTGERIMEFWGRAYIHPHIAEAHSQSVSVGNDL